MNDALKQCEELKEKCSKALAEKIELGLDLAKVKVDLEKQVATNAELIGYHAAEIERRIELEKQHLETNSAPKVEEVEKMQVEEAEKPPQDCLYTVGEEMVEYSRRVEKNKR